MTERPTMPAAFLGHGTPMNAVDDNRYTQAWTTFGTAVARPRAILAISAHWYINATTVTAMAQPKTIHDFYGFPERVFAGDYPASGDPELAAEITDLVKPTWIGHGLRQLGDRPRVLVRARARVPRRGHPVVQLSINATEPLEYHLDLGRSSHRCATPGC